MLKDIILLKHQGKQYIPDLFKAEVPEPFKGFPVISSNQVDEEALKKCCPTGAIDTNPVRLDLGKCVFCNECSYQFPDKIKFSNNHRMATNDRKQLVITEETNNIYIDESLIRKEIKDFFKGSLKLRQVSAGGDNSSEQELNAAGNVNFDMGRYGIEFVASPRHADGIVVTGPISENMAEALKIAYDAVPEPKVFILAGTDAISGGIFANSPALNRSILKDVKVDLYVPGNPIHPLTFVIGILQLTRKKFRNK
jgi:Ni,Fe-hydrogenase III small subunit